MLLRLERLHLRQVREHPEGRGIRRDPSFQALRQMMAVRSIHRHLVRQRLLAEHPEPRRLEHPGGRRGRQRRYGADEPPRRRRVVEPLGGLDLPRCLGILLGQSSRTVRYPASPVALAVLAQATPPAVGAAAAPPLVDADAIPTAIAAHTLLAAVDADPLGAARLAAVEEGLLGRDGFGRHNAVVDPGLRLDDFHLHFPVAPRGRPLRTAHSVRILGPLTKLRPQTAGSATQTRRRRENCRRPRTCTEGSCETSSG